MHGEQGRIRILIVDDHPALREGLAAMIAGEDDLLLVAQAATGTEALMLFQQHLPDVALVDLRLPDISGVEVIERIRHYQPEAKIVVLTTYPGDALASRALRAGALGYLLKATLRLELLDTIRAVHAGKRRLHAEIVSELAAHIMDDVLTQRETEVLTYVAAGLSNKAVASKLSVTEDTVKGHVRSILSKLNANDRTHAVTIALRRGFIDL